MTDSTPRLFLLDGTALAYRAHFAFMRSNLRDGQGRPTGALYGFVATLLKLIEDESPDHLGVAIDPPGPTFRHERYPEYKATRERMDDELRVQLEWIRDVVRAFDIPILEVPGFEADDVLATVARQAAEQGVHTYIVTGDKDLCQCVGDRVSIYNILKPGQDTEVLDAEGVERVWGVRPDQVADALALMGDSSDNIPGVPGVGKKTAQKLLVEHGDLTTVLDVAADDDQKVIKGKLRERLREHRDLAELSKELVVIDDHVEVGVSLTDLELGDPDPDAVGKIFREFGFTRLLERALPGAPRKQQPKLEYRTVRTEDDLIDLLAELADADLIAFDSETTGLDPLQADLVGLSFATEEGRAWYVPFNLEAPLLGDGASERREARDRLLDRLRRVFERVDRRKCAQNAKYDMLALRRAGVRVQGLVQDTLIASFCLDPESRRHGLDDLALRHFGHRKIPTSELIGTGRNQRSMAEVPVDEVSRYACEDADFTLRLARRFAPRLESESVGDLYRDVELPLVEVLADMEWEGVRLDVAQLEQLTERLTERAAELEQGVWELAGEEFNLGSPKQLSEVLFEKLKIQGKRRIRKTKTGFSTDEATLSSLEDQPIAGKVLEYRSLTKLRGTYTEALPKMVHPDTGRLHTSYSQVGAVTGRLASSDPNLQNIPIRTELGREIRKAFVPREEGWTLLSADYSQIELRILAHLSEDEHLCRAFREGADIHTDTAARIFGVAPALVAGDLRARAKAINFGIMYGMGANRLARDTGMSRKEAAAFIDDYFKAYPGVKRYLDETRATAREVGYVTTMLGRRRSLEADFASGNARTQAQAENAAVNTPIQGSAADIIKLAMLRLHAAVREQGLASRMILQVHDELVFDVAPGELETVRELVRKEMEGAVELRVPLDVEVGHGPHWLAAH